MSGVNNHEMIDAIYEKLSEVQNAFGINKKELASLLSNLAANAKNSAKDFFSYIYNWIKKALAGKDIYGKGVIMLGRVSVLTA